MRVEMTQLLVYWISEVNTTNTLTSHICTELSITAILTILSPVHQWPHAYVTTKSTYPDSYLAISLRHLASNDRQSFTLSLQLAKYMFLCRRNVRELIYIALFTQH